MGRCSAYVVAVTIVAVGLLSISATARPCKTFLVSSYSFSFQNPNDPSSSASSGFVTVFTEIHQLNLMPADPKPSSSSSSVFASLRERSRDILSVVVALLFGVGCGALTAATLYLVWTLFSARFEYNRASFEEDESDDEFIPKKMGYVKIPALNLNVKEAA
ncbi:hypothetical protein PTKIN_Ptkin15bG0101400 [Pterospermum kingtungense]